MEDLETEILPNPVPVCHCSATSFLSRGHRPRFGIQRLGRFELRIRNAAFGTLPIRRYIGRTPYVAAFWAGDNGRSHFTAYSSARAPAASAAPTMRRGRLVDRSKARSSILVEAVARLPAAASVPAW